MCGEEDDKIGEINGAGKRREERAKGGKVHDGGEGERVGPAGNRVLSPCLVPAELPVLTEARAHHGQSAALRANSISRGPSFHLEQ